MDYSKRLDEIIKAEICMTVGCTDPAAIALCAAGASSLSQQKDKLAGLEKIKVILDQNLYKNAHSARIPKLKISGIDLASMLGVIVGDISSRLGIFETVDEKQIELAKSACKSTNIDVNVDFDKKHLYCSVQLIYSDGSENTAVIAWHHDQFILLQKDGKKLLQEEVKEILTEKEKTDTALIKDLIDNIDQLSINARKKLEETVETNMKASIEDEKIEYNDFLPYGDLKDRIQVARKKVSIATYHRMSGDCIPIVACGGSGNHGITLFVGLECICGNSSKNKIETMAIALIMLHFLKKQTGVLTPICGCAFSSALACSYAIAWNNGGSQEDMLQSMNLVTSMMAGIACDGAKPSCAFKTGLGIQIAAECAILALNKTRLETGDGFACSDLDTFFEMVRELHESGMKNFDKFLVDFSRK